MFGENQVYRESDWGVEGVRNLPYPIGITSERGDEIDLFLAEQVAFCCLSRLAQCHEYARFETLIASILAISVSPYPLLTRMKLGLWGFSEMTI